MAQIRTCMVDESIVNMILSEAKRSRPISAIIDNLIDIRNKGDKAANLDGARRLEFLGIELIRIARDTRDCCY